MNRRRFVAGCGATLTSIGASASRTAQAGDDSKKPVRVGLVFLSNHKPSWPHPEFLVEPREEEILELLRAGCPGVELVPVAVRTPDQVKAAAALKDEVDGYLVYVVTLHWNLQRTVAEIGKLGKPMLLADEFLGGCGVFLRGYSDLCRQNIPAAAVSTTRMQDLVLAAQTFAEVKPDTTQAAFAARCEEVYRKTFAPVGEMKCVADPVKLTDIGQCIDRFKKSRFLIVGRGQEGKEQDFLGATGVYIGFDELKSLYDAVDQDEAAQWAAHWSGQAEHIVEPTPDWIHKAAAVYLATKELLKRHGTDSVTMNCLGGFAQGKLPAYPCLGFMEILDGGGQGVCEAMPDDTLSMLMARILTGRPGFVSDPALDTSKNQIVYAHCVATTRPLGPDTDSNRFRIRTLHDRDPRGTCAQSFLPEGYMTTSFRTDFARKKMVIHQAKAVGNLDADRGCRTQLVGEVRGDIGNLFDQWDHFGWHRVTVYGDVKEPLIEFGRGLGLEIVEEA
ncbi:MAG: hypothetical protein GXX96_11045 [Planctomycetaceae bacterium]|nr:hypothetical protein [Planctomycetaceae bacterium]